MGERLRRLTDFERAGVKFGAHHMKQRTLALSGGLLALLSLAVSPPAGAGNDKTYIGFMCNALTPDDLPFIQAGRNSDPTSVRTVFCPIVRDTMETNVLPFIRVYVRDYSPGKTLTCTLFSVNVQGLVNLAIEKRSVFQTQFPTDPVNTPYILEFINVPAGNYGFYKLICDIPPSIQTGQDGGRSGILGYWVVENDD